MANTSTALHTIPNRSGKAGPIRNYLVAIDTVDTDLDVYTPSSDQLVYVVGLSFCDATAANVTFKSNTTTMLTLELAANEGFTKAVDDGFWIATEKGKKLVVSSSAAISSMLFQIVEAGQY